MKEGDARTALKIYTVAIRSAHKAKDLAAEAQAAQSLNRAMLMRDRQAPRDGELTTDEILARLMRSLGTKHRGAVISGYHCALRVLLRATRTGERRYTKSAAEVIASVAKEKNYGASVKAVSDYAAGFVAYRERHKGTREYSTCFCRVVTIE